MTTACVCFGRDDSDRLMLVTLQTPLEGEQTAFSWDQTDRPTAGTKPPKMQAVEPIPTSESAPPGHIYAVPEPR